MILLQRRRSEDWGVASVIETARMPAMKRQLSVPEREGWLHWRFRKTFLLSGTAVLWHLCDYSMNPETTPLAIKEGDTP